MTAIGWIVLAVTSFCALYLWLIAPARKHPDASALTGYRYAHRGLHDGNHLVPENSLEAFRRAAEAGYGMELDVQQTKDGKLVVFHDGNTKRVCGVDKKILDMTYDELCQIPLPDGSRIPLFSEVLAVVDGRTPLIVEVKHYGSATKNAEAALAALRDYKGAYCMESFHPLAVRYIRKHAPNIVRGQLAHGGKWDKHVMNGVEHFAMKHLLVNAIGRPHFVAYSVPSDHTLAIWLMKRLFHPLLAAWTIRSQELLQKAEKDYDYPIFELFTPANKR